MKDYFVYLPGETEGPLWGCVTTSVGFTRVPPGVPYPTYRHPVDHHFTWSRGRVLQAYQIILISEGRGTFESAATLGCERVEAGTVLLVFPGVWHRYAPDGATGWVEHWMECRGPVFDAAVQVGLIGPQRAVLGGAMTPDVLHCFERCHRLAQRGALANQDLLATLGLQTLAALGQFQRRQQGVERAIDEIVERGHALIALRCQESLDLHGLAEELGVSYSHFRHAFKHRLGVSPKQYHLQVRLEKAQDLLANTLKPIKEIADILGFDSAFHLSKQFKSRFGRAPQTWRRSVVGDR